MLGLLAAKFTICRRISVGHTNSEKGSWHSASYMSYVESGLSFLDPCSWKITETVKFSLYIDDIFLIFDHISLILFIY